VAASKSTTVPCGDYPVGNESGVKPPHSKKRGPIYSQQKQFKGLWHGSLCCRLWQRQRQEL